MTSYIQRMLAPIIARVNNMLGKALLNALDNSNDIQVLKVQAMDGDVLGDVERVEEYGHTSRPPLEDSEVIYGALSGNRDDIIAIKVGHSKARPKDLSEGDNCFWDTHGNKIWLKDGKIALNGEDKSFVTYAELDLALQTFVTALNLELGKKLDGGGTPGTQSINISASETTTIKTGG